MPCSSMTWLNSPLLLLLLLLLLLECTPRTAEAERQPAAAARPTAWAAAALAGNTLRAPLRAHLQAASMSASSGAGKRRSTRPNWAPSSPVAIDTAK